MKKLIALLVALTMVFAMVGCADSKNTTETETASESVASESETEADTESDPVETEPESTASDISVMSYEEYTSAELDSQVCVETYVQAKQSWWEDKATVYTQNEEGAYFLYEMACSEEDYAKLTQGTKIKVTGYKSEWSGEVEIVDATFEIEEGNFVAEALDVTDKLGGDELINFQNRFVSFTGMTVEAANEEGAAYLYKWDGSGEDGDDLYFNVSLNGNTYSFTVESYLCDNTTEVYQAVKNLQVGDMIDMEGFLYWYEGVNPHITAVTVK